MSKFNSPSSLESAQEAAYQAVCEGATMKEAQEAHNLNYSQLWLGVAERQMRDGVVDTKKVDITDAKAVYAARMEEGPYSSWGWLAVRCECSESKVRRTFRTVSAVSDRGLRIGKGGRYVTDRGDDYIGEAQKHGIKIPLKGATIAKAKQVTVDQSTSIAELRRVADGLGVPSKGIKKSELLAAIQAS